LEFEHARNQFTSYNDGGTLTIYRLTLVNARDFHAYFKGTRPLRTTVTRFTRYDHAW
jgi:hypothetical protein